ncbi:hypothetical protein RRG08_041901 [Elysia crispata]|uniref:Uncharacterized protein n=1 Tax=Elysia crispata TaxID=231223 RepID=A0AAE1CRA7_9GAST|nr:hypothetical protein RRG08_041901 [Elysia crispata]
MEIATSIKERLSVFKAFEVQIICEVLGGYVSNTLTCHKRVSEVKSPLEVLIYMTTPKVVSELIRDQIVLISDRKEISSPVPGENGVQQRNGLLCHDSINPVTDHG